MWVSFLLRLLAQHIAKQGSQRSARPCLTTCIRQHVYQLHLPPPTPLHPPRASAQALGPMRCADACWACAAACMHATHTSTCNSMPTTPSPTWRSMATTSVLSRTSTLNQLLNLAALATRSLLSSCGKE
jgi:hypothetical protein